VGPLGVPSRQGSPNRFAHDLRSDGRGETRLEQPLDEFGGIAGESTEPWRALMEGIRIIERLLERDDTRVVSEDHLRCHVGCIGDDANRLVEKDRPPQLRRWRFGNAVAGCAAC